MPMQEKEKNYTFLLELQQHLMVLLKPGVICNEIYTSAVAYIEAKRPDLKDNFLRNCGFAVSFCAFV
jgi:nucleosome binding factor SPN SPT16 subunit